MNRGYFSKSKLKGYVSEENEEIPIGKRRIRRGKRLYLNQIIDIVYRTIIGKEKQADIAKEYRVTP